VIRLERESARTWTLAEAADKLRIRDGLPGAYTFDRAEAALARAEANGTKRTALLPLVFASSWLVNNKSAATVYRKWLQPPLVDVWIELASLLEGGTEVWRDLDADERATIAVGVGVLAVDGHGVGAMSKALALLAPAAAPLMPDAAIAFALGTVAMPPLKNADAQTASTDAFSPMMTWFAEAVASAADGLAAIASDHAKTGGLSLSPAQVLDRLLWFDSIGHRHFRTQTDAWWWVRDDQGEAVVRLEASPEDPPVADDGPIDLARTDLAAAWRAEARASLTRARAC
jgi:hypothetical protein